MQWNWVNTYSRSLLTIGILVIVGLGRFIFYSPYKLYKEKEAELLRKPGTSNKAAIIKKLSPYLTQARLMFSQERFVGEERFHGMFQKWHLEVRKELEENINEFAAESFSRTKTTVFGDATPAMIAHSNLELQAKKLEEILGDLPKYLGE
jgi:hypothetical protein